MTNLINTRFIPVVVSRLHSLVALLLLTLWLPATLHCELESAHLLAPHVDCHHTDTCGSEHQEPLCHGESHGAIEDSAYKSGVDTVKVSAPTLTALACLCCLTEITPETIIVRMISPARSDVPPELAPTWQFISRAAPIARAPGYLV